MLNLRWIGKRRQTVICAAVRAPLNESGDWSPKAAPDRDRSSSLAHGRGRDVRLSETRGCSSWRWTYSRRTGQRVREKTQGFNDHLSCRRALRRGAVRAIEGESRRYRRDARRAECSSGCRPRCDGGEPVLLTLAPRGDRSRRHRSAPRRSGTTRAPC